MISETRTSLSNKHSHDAVSDVAAFLRLSPVIPVVTVARVEDAVPLANALLAGGIGIIEVTFRSAAAGAAIEAIRRDCPGITVGAGTVWTAAQASQASGAGAQFLVSPGIAEAVDRFAGAKRLPYLPGAQTASEIALLASRGFRAVKFFPAHAAGGPAALAALAAVFPDVLFCPTGGVNERNAPDYLRLPYVPCVGGSWLTPSALVAQQDWSAIEGTARRAAALAPRTSAPAG